MRKRHRSHTMGSLRKAKKERAFQMGDIKQTGTHVCKDCKVDWDKHWGACQRCSGMGGPMEKQKWRDGVQKKYDERHRHEAMRRKREEAKGE